MLSVGVWDSKERELIGAETRKTKGKWDPLKWKVEGGDLSGPWRARGLGVFSSGNYEKTLEESSISVTGYDLHVEQIIPAASENPEPVGCHGENCLS